MFEPDRIGQTGLHGIVGKQRFVDVQVGRVQRFLGTPRRCHQHADFGKGGARRVAEFGQRLFHIAQISAAVARFVLRNELVDLLDDRLGMPFGGAPIPVVQTDFATKMQHQGFERGRRIERKAHRVQFRFGRHHGGPETAQILHQDQGMFLLFIEPDRHEGRKIRIIGIVAGTFPSQARPTTR